MKPLEYADIAIKSVMNKFTPEELPPAMHFHYHQGIFLEGALSLYRLTGDEEIYTYLKSWVDLFIDDDGNINNCNLKEFDDIEPGNLLMFLYEKTGDERYKRVMKLFANVTAAWPTNSEGAVWHKDKCRNQIWLDCLYMMGVFSTRYAFKFNRPALFEKACILAEQIKKHMTDEKNGLLYHMYDETRHMPFFLDMASGVIPVHWGRAQGWIAAALADILEIVPKDNTHYAFLAEFFADFMNSVFRFQDSKTGMFYQVTDMPENPRNWLETSCTSLFAYGAFKGARMGLLDGEFVDLAAKAYAGSLQNAEIKDNRLYLKNICVGTGVGPLGYYFDRPVSVNDLHGVGTFAMMCCEASRAGVCE